MPSDDRAQMPFRLMPDVMKRLEKAAKHRGLSKQAFVEGAVLREIAEAEESRRRTAPDTNDILSARTETYDKPVTGLGIAQSFQKKYAPVKTDNQPVSAPVVVNVGGGGGGVSSGLVSNDVIDRLAAFVAAARDFERSSRLRTAVGILRESSSSEEERKTLAARLDEAVAAKTKANANTSRSITRLAFDKLADLLK